LKEPVRKLAKSGSGLVFDVASDEQESIRSWVSKGGLSWCDACNVPVTRLNRCGACGSATRPIETDLRGETRPIFPGEREIQGIADIVPDDAWLAVSDNTDLAYNVLIDGRIVGDLVFDSSWKIKLSTRTMHAALYFPPKMEIDGSAIGHVLNHHNISETWVTPLAPIARNECIVYTSGNWHGLAQALVDLIPESVPRKGYAVRILSAFRRTETGARENPRNFRPDREVSGDIWRFNTLPTRFRKRMRKVVEANLPNIRRMEQRALDRIEAAVKTNPGKPIGISFSGGKDSALLAELIRQYHDQRNPEIEVHALFADTSIEFPETYEYVKKFFADTRYSGIFKLRWKQPAREFFDLWKEYGPPSRYARWCCGTQKLGSINAILDEFGSQALICTGVRAAESVSRSRRTIVDTNPYVENQIIVQPILDWGLLDVWLYVFWRDIMMSSLYLKGFNRTGCYPCPYSSNSMLMTLEKTHPELMDNLQRKLKEFDVKEDFRFRMPNDIDKSLRPLERASSGSGGDLQVQSLCAGEYFVYQKSPILLDMAKVAKRLSDDYRITQTTSVLVAVEASPEVKFRLSRTGRMIVTGAASQEEAQRIYRGVMGALTGSNGKVHCVGCGVGAVDVQLNFKV
jgi:phosphoadenosine phosphosulfate reductase